MNKNNNKFKNFTYSIAYLKNAINKKNQPLFDVVTSLYESRKIEKKDSLFKIINLLKNNKIDDANKLIKKYSIYKPAIGIKETGAVLNPERQSHNFHMMAKSKSKCRI